MIGIPCPDCGERMHIYDRWEWVDGASKMTLLATCLNTRCELHDVAHQVRTRDGNFWLLPPSSNRGVTSPSETPELAGE